MLMLLSFFLPTLRGSSSGLASTPAPFLFLRLCPRLWLWAPPPTWRCFATMRSKLRSCSVASGLMKASIGGLFPPSRGLSICPLPRPSGEGILDTRRSCWTAVAEGMGPWIPASLVPPGGPVGRWCGSRCGGSTSTTSGDMGVRTWGALGPSGDRAVLELCWESFLDIGSPSCTRLTPSSALFLSRSSLACWKRWDCPMYWWSSCIREVFIITSAPGSPNLMEELFMTVATSLLRRPL
mmetsp:Transcript_10444/g.15620  ORF Transcript_10444/g.15620 Transcript_10444/m.15620 type:complete len:238 (-) Transcript_10444:529-1242(-)